MNRFFNAQNLQGGMRANLVFTSFSGDYVLQNDQGKTLTFAEFSQADSFRVFFSYLRNDGSRDLECNYQAHKAGSNVVFTLQDRDLKYPATGTLAAYQGKVPDYWRAAFSNGKLIYNMVLSEGGLSFGYAYPDSRSSEIFIKGYEGSEPVFEDWDNFQEHFAASLKPLSQPTAGYGYAHRQDFSAQSTQRGFYGAMVPQIEEEYPTMYLLGSLLEDGSNDDFGNVSSAAAISGDEGFATTQVPNVYPDPIYKWSLRSSLKANVASGSTSKAFDLDYHEEYTFRDMRVVNYPPLVFSGVTLNLLGEFPVLNLSFKSLGAREVLSGNIVIEGTDYNFPERGTVRYTVAVKITGV